MPDRKHRPTRPGPRAARPNGAIRPGGAARLRPPAARQRGTARPNRWPPGHSARSRRLTWPPPALPPRNLTKRGRQLGEVSRQLCEVGSVGMASAARLYAAGNAATAGIATGIEKATGGLHGRLTAPPVAADRLPPSAGRNRRKFQKGPAGKILRTVISRERASRLERRRCSRQNRQNRYIRHRRSIRHNPIHHNRHGRYARHVGSTTGRERGAGSAARRQPLLTGGTSARGRERGADLDRQHHGAGSTTGPATLPE